MVPIDNLTYHFLYLFPSIKLNSPTFVIILLYCMTLPIRTHPRRVVFFKQRDNEFYKMQCPLYSRAFMSSSKAHKIRYFKRFYSCAFQVLHAIMTRGSYNNSLSNLWIVPKYRHLRIQVEVICIYRSICSKGLRIFPMRFISFFVRKLKFGCFVKLISSLVIILIIILVYKWRQQSNDFETEEIKVFGDTIYRVAMAQGLCYHLFGNKDEIELIIPLWGKLHDTKIKYYIPQSQEISKESQIESESNIIYYDEKDAANILDYFEVIYKNINRKEQWHIVINPTIVVNKTAILAELNRYKWYHPILLTFHRDTSGIEDKLELILSQLEVSIVSRAMLDKLQKMKDLEFEEIVMEIRTHWVSYKMKTLVS